MVNDPFYIELDKKEAALLYNLSTDHAAFYYYYYFQLLLFCCVQIKTERMLEHIELIIQDTVQIENDAILLWKGRGHVLYTGSVLF